MTTAEKIGLLPGFGWVADHSWWVTLLICWTLTPGLMIIIGLVLESRLIPLWSDRQFRSFFPGDLFLGMTTTAMLMLAKQLPGEHRWYNSLLCHVVVLVLTLSVAFFLTRGEWIGGAYPTRAMLSPTKLYHNVLLYGGYGYVMGMTFLALWGGLYSRWYLIIAALLPFLVWLKIVTGDSTLPKADPAKQALKTTYAHVPDWKPLWKTGKISLRDF